LKVHIPQKYLVKVLSRYSNHPRAKVIGFYTDESRRIRPITAPPEQRLEERRHEIESKIVSRPPPPTASTPSKPSRFRGLIIDPVVRTKYKEWLQASERWRNRKMLPIGSLQKYYESRKDAFVAEGGDADVFDDRFYHIDMAQAVDGWLDLDRELQKHFVTAPTKSQSQMEKEMLERYRAHLEEEKRIQELYEEYVKSFEEENQEGGVGA